MPARLSPEHRRRLDSSHSSALLSLPAEQTLLPRALLPALLLLALALVTIRPLPDPDVWFHMALGREVVEHHTLPRTDLFSFTAAGREWISSGWGSSVLLYLAYRAGGPAGLVWLTFAVAALIHLPITLTALRRFRNSGSIVLLQLAAILAAYLRYTPRPDLWSQLFLAALLLLLVTSPSGDSSVSFSGRARRLWLLPPLFALWANFHAGFLVGLVAVGVYGAFLLVAGRQAEGRRRVPFADLLPLALLACTWMLNPYGWRLLALAGKIESIPHVKEKIYEWKPLWAGGPVVLPWPAYAGIALLFGATLLVRIAAASGSAAAAASSRRQGSLRASDWWRPVLMVLFAGLAVWQRRHAGLAAVALPILLLPDLERLESRLGPMLRLPRMQALFPAFAVAAALALGGLQSAGVLGVGRGLFRPVLQASLLPVYTTRWLGANPPPGNVYNTYGAGAYLLYHLSPSALRVFIDGRLDVYDHQTWLDYLAIEDGSLPLEEAAGRYNLNTFVLYSKDCARDPNHLVFRLSDDPHWRLVFFDDSYSVFVRETPSTASYLQAHAIRYANPFAPDPYRKALSDPSRRNIVLTELNRIHAFPGEGGAWSDALASMAARRMGDSAAADQLLATAAARDPWNPLVRSLREEGGR